MTTQYLQFLGSIGGISNNDIFQEAGKGELDCRNIDGEGVSGKSDCENAAVKLNKNFMGTETAPRYPKGCYAYNNDHVYLNQHHVGARDQDSSPICKMGGNARFKLLLIDIIILVRSVRKL